MYSIMLSILLLSPSLVYGRPDPAKVLGPQLPPIPPQYIGGLPAIPTSTVSLSGSPSDKPIPATDPKTDIPIGTSKFFWIDHECSEAHKNQYKTAMKDAVAIANAGAKWPQLHTKAGELYFGKNLVDDARAKEWIPGKHLSFYNGRT